MSIGLTFTGTIDHPKRLLESAKILAEERAYRLAVGENGLKVVMCPLGGELGILWRPEGNPSGPWLVRGGCMSTPAGAGLHRAATELLDSLPIHALTVEDETGFYRSRDFQRMKEEHFYPWLRTLVDVCRQERDRGASSMQLCWDLGQYAPSRPWPAGSFSGTAGHRMQNSTATGLSMPCGRSAALLPHPAAWRMPPSTAPF